MAKIHPFPAVRIQPVGYNRYLVIRLVHLTQVGEVYARSSTEAEEHARNGRISNVETVAKATSFITFEHPDEAGERNAVNSEQQEGGDCADGE